MLRRDFIKATGATGMFALMGMSKPTFSYQKNSPQDNQDNNDKPNIVVILVDDLGYGDLSCYGSTDLKTPNIDRLMSTGKRIDNFYSNSPVCSPTRASILSGCYPDRVGVPGVIRTEKRENWGCLDKNAVLLPKVLKKR